MTKSKIFWTEEKIEEVKRLRGESKTFQSIAIQLCATKNQIISIWHRKIANSSFPSDTTSRMKRYPVHREPKPAVCKKPTLAWVPRVEAGDRYKTGVFKHE